MPRDVLSPKHEKFAQLLGTTTMSQSDAYRQSCGTGKSTDKSIWESASEIANNPKVKSRIVEIRRECQVHLKYDAEAHFRELEELKAIALLEKKKDIGSAIKATELKGKLVGLYTEKKEIKHSRQFNLFTKTLQEKESILNGDAKA